MDCDELEGGVAFLIAELRRSVIPAHSFRFVAERGKAEGRVHHDGGVCWKEFFSCEDFFEGFIIQPCFVIIIAKRVI